MHLEVFKVEQLCRASVSVFNKNFGFPFHFNHFANPLAFQSSGPRGHGPQVNTVVGFTAYKGQGLIRRRYVYENLFRAELVCNLVDDVELELANLSTSVERIIDSHDVINESAIKTFLNFKQRDHHRLSYQYNSRGRLA